MVAVDTLLQRLAPRSYIEAYSLNVHVGEALDLEALRAQLLGRLRRGHAGRRARRIRGARLAARCVPDGLGHPFRIDLLDRDVDSIRRFDPDSQRSGERLERIQLLPARETPLSPDAVREFRRRYRVRFPGDLSEHAIYRDVSQGLAPGGSSFTCRCSSSAPRICSSTCRRRA
jgi:transcription-repair coupling factor (superfamily II helicase)